MISNWVDWVVMLDPFIKCPTSLLMLKTTCLQVLQFSMVFFFSRFLPNFLYRFNMIQYLSTDSRTLNVGKLWRSHQRTFTTEAPDVPRVERDSPTAQYDIAEH